MVPSKSQQSAPDETQQGKVPLETQPKHEGRKLFRNIRSIQTQTQKLSTWWTTSIVPYTVYGTLGKSLVPTNSAGGPQLYVPLSPVSSVPEDTIEMQVLLDAFANRRQKRIFNIGVTGPYGSGKSSLIESVLKIAPEIKPTMVSLANFRLDVAEGEEAKKLKEEVEANPTRFQIETEILQQILYSTDADQLPSSRFQRIPKANRYQSFIVGAVLAALFGLLGVWGVDVTWSTLLGNNLPLAWRVGAFVLSALGAFPIAKTISRQVRRLFASMGKVRLTQIEVDLEKDPKASMLNEAIDEIIHYFEQTKSNCLIIEDLDRYGSVDLFTSLRELSDILRRSPRTKNLGIVFIYAVKDELFKDETRTKFFDLIVPVKPHTTKYNSHDQFAELNETMALGISSDVIHDLATFVESNRVVLNICNELRVLQGNGKYQLDKDKLFAITLYKNLFPADYSELLQGRGEIVKVLSSVEEVRQIRISELESEVDNLQGKLPKLERLQEMDEHALYDKYVARLLATQNHYSYNYRQFKVDNTPISSNESSKDIFKRLRRANSINGNTFNFDSWQSQVDTTPFDELLEQVGEKGAKRTQQLRDQIAETETQIAKLKAAPSTELYKFTKVNSDKESDVESFKIIQTASTTQVARFLVRNGYISNDFFAYVVSRNEGHFTFTDHAFMLNVKLSNSTNPLTDVQANKVFNALKPRYFENELVVHFGILNHAALNSGNARSISLAKSLNPTASRTREAVSKALDTFRGQHDISTLVDWLVRNNPKHAEHLSQRRNDDEVVANLTKALQQYDPADLESVDLPQTRAFVEAQTDFLGTANIPSNAVEVALALGVIWDRQNLSELKQSLVQRIRECDLLAVSRDTVVHFAEIEAGASFATYKEVLLEFIIFNLPLVYQYLQRNVAWFFTDLVQHPISIKNGLPLYFLFLKWDTPTNLPNSSHIIQLLRQKSIRPSSLEGKRWAAAIELGVFIPDWTTADALLAHKEGNFDLLLSWLDVETVYTALADLSTPWAIDVDDATSLVEAASTTTQGIEAVAHQFPQLTSYVPEAIRPRIFVAFAKEGKLELSDAVLDWAEKNASNAGRHLLGNRQLYAPEQLDNLLSRPKTLISALSDTNRRQVEYTILLNYWSKHDKLLPGLVITQLIKSLINSFEYTMESEHIYYIIEQSSATELLTLFTAMQISDSFQPSLDVIQGLKGFQEVGPGLKRTVHIKKDDAVKSILDYMISKTWISSYKIAKYKPEYIIYNKR